MIVFCLDSFANYRNKNLQILTYSFFKGKPFYFIVFLLYFATEIFILLNYFCHVFFLIFIYGKNIFPTPQIFNALFIDFITIINEINGDINLFGYIKLF